MPVIPICQNGFEYTVLLPPLPATMLSKLPPAVQPETPNCAHESFQGTSGMYESAEAGIGKGFVGVLFVFQKVEARLSWSKSVPPTAISKGVEASPETASPFDAVFCDLKLSQPAEPPSPAETSE